MRRLKNTTLTGIAMLSLSVQANEVQTIFKDCADNYPVKTNYGKAGIGRYTDFKSGGFFVIEQQLANGKKEKVIRFNSGQYAKNTSIAVNANPTARYGQLYFRIGKTGIPSTLITIQLRNNNGAIGPNIDIAPQGKIRTTAPRLRATQFAVKPGNLVDITINYDVSKRTYNLMLGDKVVARNLRFQYSTFSAPSMLVLSGAYWGKNGAGMIKAWGWRVADTPFSSKPGEEFYQGQVLYSAKKINQNGKDLKKTAFDFQKAKKCAAFVMSTASVAQEKIFSSENKDCVIIGNKYIGAAFDKKTLNLTALVDVSAGGTIVSRQEQALWSISLVDPEQVKNSGRSRTINPDKWSDYRNGYEDSIKKLVVVPDNAIKTAFFITNNSNTKTLVLNWSGISSGGDKKFMNVQAKIEVDEASRYLKWKIDVDCESKKYALWTVDFPRLTVCKFGEPGNISLLMPGRCYRILDPFLDTEQGKFLRPYPGFWNPMQFSAVYGEKKGLFLGTHDGNMYQKEFVFNLYGSKKDPTFSLTNLPEYRGRIGTDYRMPYSFVTTSFKGNWFDAARLYREWATKQLWCSKGPLYKRNDPLTKWHRELGYWTHCWEQKAISSGKVYEKLIKPAIGSDRDQTVEDIVNISKLVQVPTAVPQFMGWNKHGENAGHNIPDLFPPLIGKKGFTKQVKAIHAAGVKDVVYVWGNCWNASLPSFKKVENSTVKNPNGKTRMYGLGAAYMCPTRKEWRDKFLEIVETLARYDVDGIYWDVLAGAHHQCFDKNHGHPVGGGNYYAVGTRKFLADARKVMDRINPGMIMTSEFFSEIYIDQLDGMLLSIQNYMHGAVPVIQAVYHDYTVLFGNWGQGTYNGERWIRNLPMPVAESFVWGNQTGYHNNWHVLIKKHPRRLDEKWFEEHPELRKKYNDFVIHIARLRYHAGQKFLVYGTMMEPLVYKSPVPERKGIWQQLGRRDRRQNQYRVLPEVLNSVWKSPSGSIGLVFCNISDNKEHTIEFNLDLNKYGVAKTKNYVLLECMIDGSDKIIHTYKKRNFSVKMTIKPLVGRIYEIRGK